MKHYVPYNPGSARRPRPPGRLFRCPYRPFGRIQCPCGGCSLAAIRCPSRPLGRFQCPCSGCSSAAIQCLLRPRKADLPLMSAFPWPSIGCPKRAQRKEGPRGKTHGLRNCEWVVPLDKSSEPPRINRLPCGAGRMSIFKDLKGHDASTRLRLIR